MKFPGLSIPDFEEDGPLTFGDQIMLNAPASARRRHARRTKMQKAAKKAVKEALERGQFNSNQ